MNLRRRGGALMQGLLMLFGIGLALLTLASQQALAAQLCATPGKDGPSVNGGTYYPAASNTATAGTSTVTLGTARVDANASSTAITAGDLVMVIQMQDATINNSNSANYGDGSTGHGLTALGNSGLYEFKVVQSVAGSVLTFTTPLVNSYTNAAATATTGKKSFQIVRVPQFSSVTISGTIGVPAWNGSTGGVFAIDVAGTLTLNGTINANGTGFRGGGSVQSAALNSTTPAQEVNDYASAFVAVNGNNRGAFKGEGIAGTPRYVRDDSAANTRANLAFNGFDLGTSGYPNSLDMSQGGPANAGGGGTQHNSGGGGGGNIGNGGKGGYSYGQYSTTNNPTAPAICRTLTNSSAGNPQTYYSCGGDNSRNVGGLGGVGQTPTITRIMMGGGGGAGDNNNAADDNPNTPQSSGGAGGGIIFIRAGNIAGSGALTANGQAGQATGRDGAGGGGAGGTIVVQAPAGSYSITASANGGGGGNSGLPLKGNETQGPGAGGGGGGVILATGVSIGTQSVAAGPSGINTPVTGVTNSYGSLSGTGGVANFPGTDGTTLSSSCLPALTVTKSATPTSLVNTSSGASASYSVTIANAANQGIAQNLQLSDVLPTGFTYANGATVTFAGGASGTSPPANAGNTTTPVFTNYSLPGGGSLVITFPVAIAATVTPGTYPNTGHAKYDNPVRTTAGVQSDVPSNVANIIVYNAPAGIVYNDANHNGAQDGAETSTGLTGLVVKAAPYTGGVCQTPAVATANVDPTSGTWAITTALTAGDYCLILDNNTNLADVTPSTPTGWVGTEAASGIRIVTVGAAVIPPQNFGLFSGSTLKGRVFLDNGSGGGTANDGVQNGSEAGISGVTVGGLTGTFFTGTTVTDSSGNYTLYIPTGSGPAISITETLPTNLVVTGGSAGNTGGTYTRATNVTAFTLTTGQTYTGVNFANAPANTFTPDGVQTTGPGTVVFYPHTFTPGSGGSVTFGTSATSSPTLTGWTETIYQDTNCNGKLDSGEPLITNNVAGTVETTSAVTATAGTPICIIVRESVPANARVDMSNQLSVSAKFVYTYAGDPNAATAPTVTLLRTDTTTVGTPAELALTKQVRNVTKATGFTTSNTASPSDVVEYQLTFTNQGTTTLGNVVVSDATPAYTTYLSAACPATIPAATGLTACAISTQPAVGATGGVQWTFTGNLRPGGSLAVTYQVKVSP